MNKQLKNIRIRTALFMIGLFLSGLSCFHLELEISIANTFFAAWAIFPLAFIMGSIRGIPFWWQLVDCSFGVIGLMVMVPVYKMPLNLIQKNT